MVETTKFDLDRASLPSVEDRTSGRDESVSAPSPPGLKDAPGGGEVHGELLGRHSRGSRGCRGAGGREVRLPPWRREGGRHGHPEKSSFSGLEWIHRIRGVFFLELLFGVETGEECLGNLP